MCVGGSPYPFLYLKEENYKLEVKGRPRAKKSSEREDEVKEEKVDFESSVFPSVPALSEVRCRSPSRTREDFSSGRR